ncbi:MAG: ABC transporter ATP-binding protein [Oligoflexia bacterium]|nr:ABC transporter ATP-binding protein [Oligoflexia bacterium]
MNDSMKVSLKNISKSFYGNWANKDVNFDLYRGEIHALLGENGAGKSTLMNILAGLYHPDKGNIFLDGREVKFNSPADALDAGIGMVHQHFSLVKNLTVAQNVLLGTKGLKNFFSHRDLEQIVSEFSNQCKINVDPTKKVWQLSVGEQEKVEILKLLYRKTKILILDEPTAVLTPLEIEELFQTLERLVRQGDGSSSVSVVLITHKMKEVIRIADRISVMRRGEMIQTLKSRENAVSEGASEVKLAELMMGEEKEMEVCECDNIESEKIAEESILEIQNISVRNDRKLMAVKELNLNLFAGEILGIAGVAGNGQVELLEAIAGIRDVENKNESKIILDKREISKLTIKERIKIGLRYIPADRHRDAMVGTLPLKDSVMLKDYDTNEMLVAGFLSDEKTTKICKKIIDDFKVIGPGEGVPFGLYSGGNQQKVVMGRELRLNPKIILAHSPTRGLDLMTTSFIHQLLKKKRIEGVGIIFISEDIDELMKISDRIAVMSAGVIKGILKRDEFDRVKIGLLM